MNTILENDHNYENKNTLARKLPLSAAVNPENEEIEYYKVPWLYERSIETTAGKFNCKNTSRSEEKILPISSHINVISRKVQKSSQQLSSKVVAQKTVDNCYNDIRTPLTDDTVYKEPTRIERISASQSGLNVEKLAPLESSGFQRNTVELNQNLIPHNLIIFHEPIFLRQISDKYDAIILDESGGSTEYLI